MRLKSVRHARGFTLIEIIITLTVTAVLATMIYTYFGKAFTESVAPISRLKKSAYIQKIMQNIMADFSYNGHLKWSANKSYSSDLVNPDIVIPISRNGHSYKCTIAGTSGASEPAWKIGSVTQDASITWADNGPPLAVSELKTRIINTPRLYKLSSDPDYIVLNNKCIRFDPTTNVELASEDGSCTDKTLKVTLQSDSGETLTALFVSE